MSDEVVLVKNDSDLIQRYLLGIISLSELRVAISNNHDTDYDLDDIYEYLDLFYAENDIMNKIDNLQISNKLKVPPSIFKRHLREVVEGRISITELSNLLRIKRGTITGYLAKIGYTKTSSIEDTKTLTVLKAYYEGIITKYSAKCLLEVSSESRFDKLFDQYVKKYKNGIKQKPIVNKDNV